MADTDSDDDDRMRRCYVGADWFNVDINQEILPQIEEYYLFDEWLCLTITRLPNTPLTLYDKRNGPDKIDVSAKLKAHAKDWQEDHRLVLEVGLLFRRVVCPHCGQVQPK